MAIIPEAIVNYNSEPDYELDFTTINTVTCEPNNKFLTIRLKGDKGTVVVKNSASNRNSIEELKKYTGDQVLKESLSEFLKYNDFN